MSVDVLVRALNDITEETAAHRARKRASEALVAYAGAASRVAATASRVEAACAVGPSLSLGRIADSDDERIANALGALVDDQSIAASAARWAIENWQTARTALVAIRETAPSAEVLEIVAEGLEVADD